MHQDMSELNLSELHEILLGNLQPWRINNQYPDAHFRNQLTELNSIKPKTIEFYRIDTASQLFFTPRTRYYQKLIDNAVKRHINQLAKAIDANKSENLAKYLLKTSNDATATILHEAAQTLRNRSLHIKNLTNDDIDFAEHQDQKEYTVIVHYMIASLVKCRLEVQEHYTTLICPDELYDVASCYTTFVMTNPNQLFKIEKNDTNNGNKKSKIKPNDCTFLFEAEDDVEFNAMVESLFNKLIKHELIPKNTDKEYIIELFSGEKANFTIQWLGSNSIMAFWIKKLIKDKIITIPSGVTHWHVVSCRFVGTDGKQLPNLGKENSRKSEETIVADLVSAFE